MVGTEPKDYHGNGGLVKRLGAQIHIDALVEMHESR